MKRCEAYRLAGADAVLVHSKLGVADEIFAFMKEWGNRLPVVIVPTKYYATPTDSFREAGHLARDLGEPHPAQRHPRDEGHGRLP